MRSRYGGIDVLGWVQAAEPPMDIPRKQNPRKTEDSDCSVRSAYCGTRTERKPNIRLANSCGTLAHCVDEKIKTHVDQFKIRESKKKDKRTKQERKEQKIIDLLTVKAALSVLRESCWYWGNISGDRARKLLKRCEPGTFLIRDSSDKRYLFTLSIMTLRGPTSIRLIFSRGCFRIETSGIISPRSPCVVSLIVRMAYLSRNSVCEQPIKERMDENEKPTGKVDSQHNQTFKKQALLEKPLFSKAASLKHLARVAINRYNLRSFVSESAAEYLNQYPYPV